MSYENNTRYVPGQWNVHCDVCGFKFKSGQIRKRWDGLMVCGADWETDHPQKYIKVNETSQIVPYVRKESSDYQFVQSCDLWTSQARADFGTAGCATVGNVFPIDMLIELFRPSSTSIAGIAIAGRGVSGVI